MLKAACAFTPVTCTPPVKYFYWPFQVVLLLWIICVIYVLCFSCFRARLFIAALWSPAGKGLISWLLFVMFNYVCVTFPCGILGQVWYLIVSIPDLCRLSYLLSICIQLSFYLACATMYIIIGNQGVTLSVPTAFESSGYGMGHAWVTEDECISVYIRKKTLWLCMRMRSLRGAHNQNAISWEF